MAARKDGYSIAAFNSSMDYYWASNGRNITGCVYDLINFDKLAAMVILAGDLHDTQMQEELIHKACQQNIPVFWVGGTHSGNKPVSPAGTPLCFANPSKDHYEATFRDGDEEWTYVADRNENGYLGVWILL